MSSIAFVVLDSGSLHAQNETPFYNRLDSTLGHTVTIIDDSDAESTDYSTYDMIFVSRQTTTSLVDGLKSEDTPILFTKRGLETEYGFGTGSSDYSEDETTISDNTHYITSETSLGDLIIYGGADINSGISGYANDVTELAIVKGHSGYADLLVIDLDETLTDSSTAAERRVFFGMCEGDQLNAAGWDLFDRAIGWCLYEDGGTAWTKNLTETMTITGAITEEFTKEVVETMTLTDVIAQDFGKTLSETFTITGTLSRDTIKALTESMTITGAILAAIGEHFTVNLTETLTITDSLHKILYDLSVFDPVTVVQVILYSNWNETTVGRPTIRSFVKRDVEQGVIKRWNYLLNGDLIGISEVGFEKAPHSAGYNYTSTVIKLKLNVGTAKGRTHLFAVFDELRRSLHEKRGAPTSAYTSWRPLIVTNRTIHHDKYKNLWKMDVFVELREKCYALA